MINSTLIFGLKILNEGQERSDRTGTGTIGLFGESLTFDLSDGLPILNTKQVGWKWALIETIWMFCKGSSDTTYLDEKGVSIWREWTVIDKNTGKPTIGNLYGPVLRGNVPDGVDQMQYVIDLLKNDPYSRRICMTAWDPRFIPLSGKSFQENVDLGRGVLSNCHSAFIQFYVSDKNEEDIVKELIKKGYKLEEFQNLSIQEAVSKYNLNPRKLNAFTHQRSADLRTWRALQFTPDFLRNSYASASM